MIDALRRFYHGSILFEIVQRVRAACKSKPLRSRRTYIQNVVTHPIQDDVFMEVYWVSEPVGPGPGASIYIRGDEVLRFDCFGSDVGHFHFNVRQARYLPCGELSRILFPPGTVQDHIAAAAVHLRRNLEYARSMNLEGRVRAVKLHQPSLETASEVLRCELMRIAASRQ